jgi:hypothetical protein
MQHDYLARRELLGVVSVAALLSKSVFADDERSGDMIYRKLGRTGERVLLAKTREAALSGKLETFKTTTRQDGTARNPQWMG